MGLFLVFKNVYGGRGVLSLRVHGRFSFNAEIVRRIVRVGIPAAVEQGLMRSAQLIYGMIVAGMDTVSIAAHAVALTAESISFMPGAGFSLAATTLVGQSLGAGDPERAERSGYESGKMATLVMTGMGVLFFAFPRFFVGCRSGGTGRRAAFRAQWPQGRVGSNPTFGTKASLCKIINLEWAAIFFSKDKILINIPVT
jgi:Na+-driven multidrug efflux pump